MNNILCLIQIHYSDFQFPIRKYNPLEKLLNSKTIDKVVLIAPDMEENAFIKDFADENGVGIYFGDKDDVVTRMIDAAHHFDGFVVVRPSIRWFMIDTALIAKQINYLLDNECDYVTIPHDFDERFSAEVFSVKCLEGIHRSLNNDAELKRKYKFNPAAFLELEDHSFKVAYYDEVPVYLQSDFVELEKHMKLAWPQDGKGEAYIDRPIPSYEFVKKYVRQGDITLDIACGSGYGTNLISKKSMAESVGVDVLQMLTDEATRIFSDNEYLTFVNSDFNDLDYENKFDKIISLHTMEHVDDDELFLQKLHLFLKEDGELLLEVPKLRTRPFVDISTPINPDHVREYVSDELKQIVSKHFTIKEVFGVNHGFYTIEDKARSAIFIRAHK